MKQVVVVIPIHNNSPSQNELASFAQCFKILQRHPIIVLAPDNLCLEKYKDVVTEFDVVFIDPVWQSSIEQYNKLKISSFFYSLFKEYNFLLTYELDAWVFKDELEFWCNKGYDYVGAPWFEGWGYRNTTIIIGVGNSGFSLRNIQSSIRILNRIKVLKKIRSFWFKSHLQAVWRFSRLVLLFKRYLHIRSMKELNISLLENKLHEDYYWAHFITGAFTDYNVAPVEDAFKFSFEVNPTFLYEKNHNQLPFGCHAWEKYQPEFWEVFINVEKKLKQNND